MRKVTLALVAVLAVAVPVHAQCYSAGYGHAYSSYSYPSYSYYPSYVEKIVIKEVPTVLAVLTPVISTGYVPPLTAAPAVAQQTAQSSVSDAKLDEIKNLIVGQNKRIDALERAVQALQEPVPPQPLPPPQPTPPAARQQSRVPTGPAALRVHCAACHTNGKLFARGDRQASLAIFNPDGVTLALDKAGAAKCLTKISKGEMPLDNGTLKANRMPPEDVAMMEEYLTTLNN